MLKQLSLQLKIHFLSFCHNNYLSYKGTVSEYDVKCFEWLNQTKFNYNRYWWMCCWYPSGITQLVICRIANILQNQKLFTNYIVLSREIRNPWIKSTLISLQNVQINCHIVQAEKCITEIKNNLNTHN